jgi:hypothetical protein
MGTHLERICEQSDYRAATTIVSRAKYLGAFLLSMLGGAFADKSVCLEDSLASGRLNFTARDIMFICYSSQE